MKKKTKIIVTSIAVTVPLFVLARLSGIAERGNQSMGAEMFLILIPVIVWLFIRNWKLTKDTFRDCELSDEAINTPIIRCNDEGGSVQIIDYKCDK